MHTKYKRTGSARDGFRAWPHPADLIVSSSFDGLLLFVVTVDSLFFATFFSMVQHN